MILGFAATFPVNWWLINRGTKEKMWAIQFRPTEDARRLLLVSLCALALVVGIVTGIGAVVFRALIGLVHNLMFLGQLSFDYDSSVFTAASPWGALVILVPVLGGIGVTFIVSNFAPEAKGHGVPEVMDAIYYHRGIIRPVVAVAKSLASALAIGSGAAVGREGPIIQIGSALGSTLGQLIRMSMGQHIILVAAGAGAGIAATFNTPIGGVLFATELMMPEISVNTFLPVAIATGTATFIGRLFFGDRPAFAIPADLAPLPAIPSSALILFLYVALAAVTGIAAALFVRSLHWAEDLFEKIPGRYLRHAAGMLLVGALIYGLMRWGGHYYVEGVGCATIQATLTGQLNVAVAVGLGVRRMLSRENIYTMKLVRRGHPIPKALHANMFLVRSARDVMDKDFLLVRRDNVRGLSSYSGRNERHPLRRRDARKPDRRGPPRQRRSEAGCRCISARRSDGSFGAAQFHSCEV